MVYVRTKDWNSLSPLVGGVEVVVVVDARGCEQRTGSRTADNVSVLI